LVDVGDVLLDRGRSDLETAPILELRREGLPRTVLLRGKTIVENRNYVGEPGEGRFLKRQRYQPRGNAALR